MPFSRFSVCMTASNLSILFMIAICHPIVFSNLYFSKFLFQSLFFLLSNAPRQPFLLSYSISPFLNAFDAKFWNSRFIGVLILKPCLWTLSYPYCLIIFFLTSSTKYLVSSKKILFLFFNVIFEFINSSYLFLVI